MKRIVCTFILSAGVLLAVGQEIAPAKKGAAYGAPIEKKEGVSLTEMETIVTEKGVFEGKVSGKVTEVCLEKGCWMRIEKANGETMLVRFKDYGFFMPKDLVGHNVLMDGEAKIKELSVAQQKHYAEDGGKSKEEIEKITQPKKDVQFLAKGVLVL